MRVVASLDPTMRRSSVATVGLAACPFSLARDGGRLDRGDRQ